jgi:hypothetical protein
LLLSLGGNFFLEIRGKDKKAKRLFSTKFGNAPTSRDPNFIIECKEKIGIHPSVILNEMVIKPFCVTDSYNFAYIKGDRKLVLPFQDIGKKAILKIEYEKGFPVDWLRFIFDQVFAFHILKDGFSLLHAASIARDGKAILLSSWRASGKTSTTINMLLHGNRQIEYIGEDFTLISNEGTAEMYSDAFHLDFTHLRQFPEIRNPFSAGMKLRLHAKDIITTTISPSNLMMEYLLQGLVFLLSPGSKSFTKISNVLPSAIMSSEPKVIEKAYLLRLKGGANLDKVKVRKIDPEHFITRMIMAMFYERKEFIQLYAAYAYATGTPNHFVEKSMSIERSILSKSLKNAECFELEVPIVTQDRFSKVLQEITSIVVDH